MSKTLLKIKDVCALVALSESAIYAAIKNGTFPKPVRLSVQSVGWVSSEIQQWINERIEERDKQ